MSPPVVVGILDKFEQEVGHIGIEVLRIGVRRVRVMVWVRVRIMVRLGLWWGLR